MARVIWEELLERFKPYSRCLVNCRVFVLATSVGCFGAITVSGSKSFYFVLPPPESLVVASPFGSSSSLCKVLLVPIRRSCILPNSSSDVDVLYAVSIHSPQNTPYLQLGASIFLLFLFFAISKLVVCSAKVQAMVFNIQACRSLCTTTQAMVVKASSTWYNPCATTPTKPNFFLACCKFQEIDYMSVCLNSRSHGGHELLRHSPLGKKASGVDDEGKRSARGWGEAEGGDAVSADGNGDEGASSSSRPTSAGAGAGDEEGAPLGGGGGGAVARDPQQADIEREVRQQQRGGVRTDGSGIESGGGLQRKESLAVSQARELLLQGLISSEELEAVVQKDQVRGGVWVRTALEHAV